MVIAYKFPEILQKHSDNLLADWIKEQHAAITHRRDLIKDAELEQQSKEFLNVFIKY
ncbi:RsbRD N-terminal domain-containing protein [Methanospirillum hungatei]|uniref:RsbRD N-terminal domain-containing protein n=1 Tax=Methanospirillum hungatei TaxID=2203 RepID=UPI0026E9F0FE|nr:RsbRD N-terminal domain-containing protein [Methanospirillum hungatei]